MNYGIRLRNFIGVIVMLLPVLSLGLNLIFGQGHNPPGVLSSISATYYSISFAIFIITTGSAGVLMLFYNEYDIQDRTATKIAGIGALALVIFPCALPGAGVWNAIMAPQNITNIIHLAGAFSLFASMVYLVGFQFVKTGEGVTIQPGSKKWRRNILYRVCAATMGVALIIGFGGSRLFGIPYLVFIGESIAFEALGIAWNTKGGMWFKDI